MDKIESLTPEQTAKMSEYKDKWCEIGLSTERVDFEKARAALIKSYESGGVNTNKLEVLFAAGPTEAVKIAAKYGITADEALGSILYGSHSAGWLSFYDFCINELSVTGCDKIAGLIELAKTSGWVVAFDELAIISDRPTKNSFDEQGRVHCEDGPAISYRDGTEVYVWHGTTIPENWIKDKSSLTAKIAISWENIEQRRCACEILGWDRVLEELSCRVIDEDEDPMIGTLLEVDLPELGKERFIKVLCGTGRTFAIPVPPEMNTALEANAWTYGLGADDLKIEVRT